MVKRVEAALRFLFNAMAPKPMDDFPFHGIPSMMYLDNGPVAKSHVFQQVMRYLEVDVPFTCHKARRPARDGAVEGQGGATLPHGERNAWTLYHFHEPRDEAEANAWLMHFLVHGSWRMQHRSEPHSRLDDWLQHHPVRRAAVCLLGTLLHLRP